MRLNLYLNPQEFKALSKLKIQTGYTKNALIRQMINQENMNPKIQEQQEIHKIFVNNIHRIGNNLNQIAYKLNANAESLNQNSLSVILEEIKELKTTLQDYKIYFKKPKSKQKYHKTKDSQNV
ncbi:CopG family transcriptional regulator [Helicobacter sp. MIT 05-5294]|uniref:ribbon-helix-helix domain-containing protein n=1 Tax=Helicobacter sp. MIT 05-5294 TaxID=1548150 RepID=UPI00051FC874|nr:CopG family transcriptional regulator [Helicobacter sp. MIT 05-5294]TLD85562.1 plasmid mobilization relaxosome protein MobC [Helicobacter sp. MIT 05-5294]